MKLFLLEFFIAARFVNLAVSLPQYQFASHTSGKPLMLQEKSHSDFGGQRAFLHRKVLTR
jgi:hypothetical protein